MPAATTKAGRRLSALWETDRALAAAECILALARANGDTERAAKELGVSRRTLFRWRKEHPELKEDRHG